MTDQLVCMGRGVVVQASDLKRLLDLEVRGVHFSLADDGKVCVGHSSLLTDDDKVFLRQHHNLVMACLTATYTDDNVTTVKEIQ